MGSTPSSEAVLPEPSALLPLPPPRTRAAAAAAAAAEGTTPCVSCVCVWPGPPPLSMEFVLEEGYCRQSDDDGTGEEGVRCVDRPLTAAGEDVVAIGDGEVALAAADAAIRFACSKGNVRVRKRPI